MRFFIHPVGEDQDKILIIFHALLPRIDLDRTVHPALLLKSCVRVIPVGARLLQGKFVSEGLSRSYGRSGEIRYAIKEIRK